MHSKFQRRLHRAERSPLMKRQTSSDSVDSSNSDLDTPITITVTFQTIPDTSTTSSPVPTSSLAQSTSTSATPIGTLLNLPTHAVSRSSSTAEQTISTATSAFTTSTSTIASVTSVAAIPLQSSNGTTANSKQDLSSPSSPSLSSGSVAGIVVGVLILLLVALFFGMRTRFMRNRQQRRRSRWTQSKLIDPPSIPSARPTTPPPLPEASPFVRTETADTAPDMAYAEERPRILTVRNATPSIISSIASPPASYNNVASPAPATSTGQSFASGAAFSAPFSSPGSALVVCTFICTLPDELAISIGESLRILAEYDDGWALCMNISGEQGMVPIECLKTGASEGSISNGYSLSELDMRRSRRATSLSPSPRASKVPRS